ncbi:CapD2 [Desulforapulum autotrophicum HRM2]|uniref:CapD2 n=1 Tax=Desulforapulum autotrophicum (strain ATCC 43914 / DSM 3382 / VKM B-1955 / HRM2) TaxID=177437 RepID=C0QK33_DESAH|nr:nucleoside-diphosphate sugar epimerase/dehydratase [Desulforapulum autotrophicum]ACN16059.1 CapD2 [Desulforapulum autotrophicum HRM2]
MKNSESPSFHRNLIIVFLVDAFLAVCAIVLAYMIRFEFNVPDIMKSGLVQSVALVLVVKMPVFYAFNMYRGMWRYTSGSDVVNVIKASILSSLLIMALVLFVKNFGGFSRSVFAIDLCLTIFLLSGFRLCVKKYFEISAGNRFSMLTTIGTIIKDIFFRENGATKLLIIGAGSCGERIVREIIKNSMLKYKVVGFLDDNPKKIGKTIHGITVLNVIDSLEKVAKKVEATEVLIAIPTAEAFHMRRIIDICKDSGLKFKIIPDMGELINGNVSVSAIRDLSFRDLLGREPVRLDQGRIGEYLENQVILITGAGGSIGSELCRQICRFNPATLVLYDNAETPLYEIDHELKNYFKQVNIVPVLGDIRDRFQFSKALEAYSPVSVFHAAAYKHVPMLEIHPWEAVLNNIMGTVNVAECCKRLNVQRFVLMSTDKAVRPSSVMGASKRISEIFVQNQSTSFDHQTKFMIVRFGNVAGSAGSVVPLFKKQIRSGGPVTVTHPDVTRFFMTIPEACQLILQAGAMGKGGEIFILDMGRPVKIADMAADMIRLSGYQPGKDIAIKYIGLRPGEKMFEELVAENEVTLPTEHDKITVLNGSGYNMIKLNGKIDQLEQFALEQNCEMIFSLFEEILPGYRPYVENESAFPPN